ncbi:MAG TPA: phosphoenolpyruvate carboxykinase (GTP) [Chthoniobacterales bacterium]|jgi:phosphoenolpyruvate carboxykinase (GTP)|nr:phosphoenolpyruvate carboxykinase (GTP) [Chthoniobacterales bacterium]
MDNLAPAVSPPAGIGDTKPANPAVLAWVEEVTRLTQPENIFWCDGSEKENAWLLEEAERLGVVLKLNEQKKPGSYLHRSNPNDVARVEQFTLICTPTKEEAGPTNNWAAPDETYTKLHGMLRGAMKGRTMFVVPYIMGPPDSPLTKVGFEVTDSIYVVLSMRIMTRMGTVAVERLGNDAKGEWNRGVHSLLDVNPERRLICHFPQDNAIISVGSGYGGNVLLSKKCLALRIGSYLARKQGWLAEHMLILGVEAPDGRKHYVAAAFPSACGKTNFAMLIPPAHFKGWKVTTIGDDIAWMQIGEDGRLYAVNPENGYFGVVPGTSYKSNPNAMKSIERDTLYTNVGVTDDGDVWWEGKDGGAPAHLIDWKGNDWTPDSKEKAAHPNSRFAVPMRNNPVLDSDVEKGEGVPISAIIFGGRRSDTMPLVFQAFDWVHGVYAGATMASETTAAATGAVGQVRRDPMAMLPFCGYSMGNYFRHWLEIGPRLKNPPLIFHVNWFRKGADGKFLWPGFGDNMRVLEWIIRRCEGNGEAQESPIGYVPRPEDLDLDELNGVSEEQLSELLAVNSEEWKTELEGQAKFFETLKPDMPERLLREREKVEKRFAG